MEIEWKTFKKLCPHLASEMERGVKKVPIRSVRTDVRVGEGRAKGESSLVGFTPDAVDFIRRCDTERQALEILDYLERKGEISIEYAGKLKTQLKERGLRSFGERKAPGYYFRIKRPF
jgi:hypothetical protein